MNGNASGGALTPRETIDSIVAGLAAGRRATRMQRKVAESFLWAKVVKADVMHPVSVENANDNLVLVQKHFLSGKSTSVPKRVAWVNKGGVWKFHAVPSVRGRRSGGKVYKVRKKPGSFVSVQGAKKPTQVIQLIELEGIYPKGGKVTVEDLVRKGVVSQGAVVKVIGTGHLKVKLDVEVDQVTAEAVKTIRAAGGRTS